MCSGWFEKRALVSLLLRYKTGSLKGITTLVQRIQILWTHIIPMFVVFFLFFKYPKTAGVKQAKRQEVREKKKSLLRVKVSRWSSFNVVWKVPEFRGRSRESQVTLSSALSFRDFIKKGSAGGSDLEGVW